MDRINLTLCNISREQEIAIKELFRSRGWDYAPQLSDFSDRNGRDATCILDGSCDLVSSLSVDCDALSTAAVFGFEADSDGTAVSGVSVPAVSEAGVDAACQGQSDGFGTQECASCFCSPCVTDVRQQWLGNGQKAHSRNSGIRKRLYRKYWSMINTRGAWRHPLYLRKKTDTMLRDHVDDSVVKVLRDIMPDCVLQLVRDLYPNPHGIPYLGHKWW